MKFVSITFLAFFALKSFAYADCDTKKVRRELVKTFQVNSSPTDWKSVKRKSLTKATSLKNKAFRIVVYATNRINTSKIEYKRNTYDLADTRICSEPQGFSISHKSYGTLYIKRGGTAASNSYIRLQKGKGGIKIYLRPKEFVK